MQARARGDPQHDGGEGRGGVVVVVVGGCLQSYENGSDRRPSIPNLRAISPGKFRDEPWR